MSEKTFEELQAERDALQTQLDAANKVADASVLKIRQMETDKLTATRAQADEALAQRVAEILAGRIMPQAPRVHGTTIGNPAMVVGHHTLVCRVCNRSFDADAINIPSCSGKIHLSHDFYGADTEVKSIDRLEAHHAIHIDGTVMYPQRAA